MFSRFPVASQMTEALLPDSWCHRLERGGMDIEVIGFYGGATGDARFVVVSVEGYVWDVEGTAFNLQQQKVLLQENLRPVTVTKAWPNLRGYYLETTRVSPLRVCSIEFIYKLYIAVFRRFLLRCFEIVFAFRCGERLC